MMHWDRLINDKRLGLEDYHDPKSGSRSDFQRDFDRLVFSSPFRRLQNKTQVFPLPGSIFVHNRLTHSMEVASVGRSLANEISRELRMKYRDEPWCDKLEAMGEIVSAACLAHDLGNPPFGHSGEKAISTFFSEGAGAEIRNELTEAQWADLINFEGNANSFRLLTHQFKGRRKGGFAMTYSMLASVVKYPYESRLAGGKSKFGFFSTEIDTFKRIAEELGLEMRNGVGCGAVSYARHPLVYIVEAADDICYHMVDVMDKVEDPNEKIGYLRSCVIGTLVKQCARTFVDNEPAILAGEFEGSLLDNIALHEREGYRRCSALAWDKIYRASDVVDVELAGNRIITFLMEKLIHAVRYPELNYSSLLLSKVPEQYDIEAPTLFGKIQAVLDHISGMTDVYALDLYRKLYGMSLPAV